MNGKLAAMFVVDSAKLGEWTEAEKETKETELNSNSDRQLG